MAVSWNTIESRRDNAHRNPPNALSRLSPHQPPHLSNAAASTAAKFLPAQTASHIYPAPEHAHSPPPRPADADEADPSLDADSAPSPSPSSSRGHLTELRNPSKNYTESRHFHWSPSTPSCTTSPASRRSPTSPRTAPHSRTFKQLLSSPTCLRSLPSVSNWRCSSFNQALGQSESPTASSRPATRST